LTEKSQI